MKKNLFISAMAAFLSLIFIGCATEGPKWVDLRVYNSSANREAAKNNAATADYQAREADYDQQKERGTARHEKKLLEIKSGKPGDPVVSSAGIIGGVDVIIKSIAYEEVDVHIKKIDGTMVGYHISFTLPKKSSREFKLETGTYEIKWVSRNYPGSFNKPEKFTVTPEPHYTDLDTGREYHGGYKINRSR